MFVNVNKTHFTSISLPIGCKISLLMLLFQVLNEAMRLFPPLPVHYRKAIKELDLGRGHIIPAGTNIIMSAYTVHRDPRHIPDPETFDPERFSPENNVGRHPYAYIHCGFDSRMFVGYKFAIIEIKTILSTVLRRYNIDEFEGGIKGLEGTLKLSYVLSPANGIRVKLLPRSHQLHIGGTQMCEETTNNSLDISLK
jgi:cytochrome P450